MIISDLEDFTKGWFVGDFEPTLIKTKDAEAAIKRYVAGDEEDAHYHKVATEITGVIVGEIEMNGQRFGPGKLVTVVPGEVVKFKAILDSITFVVKVPCVKNDKYVV